MKIRCPQCQRISEIPHVDHGRVAVCACRATFRIDDSTVMEEFSLPDLPPPETIGRYRIARYLGRGATNCVYEGIHPELGVPVAVKTLLPEYAADKPSRDRFLHAAKIYAKAVHPNIVKVYETGKDANGVPFLAMEYLPGGTLADSMQKNGFFTAKEAAKIGAEICRALVVTAGLGIVHRDIKPDNIMLSVDGQYKLTDLGLAKLDPSSTGNVALVLDENEPGESPRKTSFGTLEYMSPEQYIDTESCDARSDIYSLGVTLYQLAAGRLPFETQTRSELRHMHISVEPLVPSSYVHGIPIDFDYIVMHCIQKRPEDRYNSPEELLADLESFLADAPLPSTTSGAVPLDTGTVYPGETGRQSQSGSPFRSLFYSPVTIVLLILGIVLLTGAYLYKLRGTRAAKKQQEQLSAPGKTQESAQDSSGFTVQPSTESVTPRIRPSANVLDAEITIGGVNVDTQASGLFEETRKAAAQAMENGFGFGKAMDDLDTFSSSEQYQKDALELISELKKASDAAVAALMESLDRKAAPLLEAGNYDAAINVYGTDIGPLAPESRIVREQKILEIEKMRQAAAPVSGGSPTEEAPLP